jgi:hypothetical protein
MDEIPIVCTLPAAELRERERTVLAALGAQVRKVATVECGQKPLGVIIRGVVGPRVGEARAIRAVATALVRRRRVDRWR